jgi:hypothetical protein
MSGRLVVARQDDQLVVAVSGMYNNPEEAKALATLILRRMR